MIENPKLNAYQFLVLASLRAQAQDDTATEDRIIDELDSIWAVMSPAERRLTEDLNKEAIAWHAHESRIKKGMRLIMDVVTMGEISGFSQSVGDSSDSSTFAYGRFSSPPDIRTLATFDRCQQLAFA